MTKPRKGQAPPTLSRVEFAARFRQRFADPAFEAEREALTSRVLLVCGAARNDGTCPGEISKTFRLTALAREVLDAAGAKPISWI